MGCQSQLFGDHVNGSVLGAGLRNFALLLVTFVTVACETTPPDPGVGYLQELGGTYRLGAQKKSALTSAPYWDDSSHARGEPFILINLRTQQAQFYKGDTLVGVSPISSGTEGRNTPAGDYTILEKDADHFSSSYGSIVDMSTGKTINWDATPKTPVPPGAKYEPAPMPHFMRLTWDGVGMHEGFLPGYPASHGCIRMDKEMAKAFYDNAKKGTRVRVIR